MAEPLPVEIDFHELDTHQRLVVIYRLGLRIKTLLEDHMSESRREADEQIAKTAELTDAVNAGFGRFVQMVNDRDATIATQAEEIARLRNIEAADVETAAILDQSQRDIDATIAQVNKAGLPVVVPPPEEPPADTPLSRRKNAKRGRK